MTCYWWLLPSSVGKQGNCKPTSFQRRWCNKKFILGVWRSTPPNPNLLFPSGLQVKAQITLITYSNTFAEFLSVTILIILNKNSRSTLCTWHHRLRSGVYMHCCIYSDRNRLWNCRSGWWTPLTAVQGWFSVWSALRLLMTSVSSILFNHLSNGLRFFHPSVFLFHMSLDILWPFLAVCFVLPPLPKSSLELCERVSQTKNAGQRHILIKSGCSHNIFPHLKSLSFLLSKV